MENFPTLVPLMILIPAVGAFINIFVGARLSEKFSSRIAIIASASTFVVAALMFIGLTNTHNEAVIVNPPLLDGWIRIGDSINIPWQMRVDTLSVTMMLFVSFVGTLIHVYAVGYMHGDARFARFFAYLNMFLAFMFILVTGNNFLMMFVGWEGVGLCSFLLIGFWFDKAHGEGWKNSNAAKKAMILNRIGDFGMLMAMFLTFWTFGTLDYYRPGEIANVELAEEQAHEAEGEHGERPEGGESDHSEEGEDGTVGEDEQAQAFNGLLLTSTAAQEDDHSEEGAAAAEGEHGEEEDGHGEAAGVAYSNNEHILTENLGVFGQSERLMEANAEVELGPFTMPIQTVITLITLFLLLGAAGKSAQIPLFVWLPDAMAGPTPVSALIHAATMVTAGVYMMVRSNVLFHAADFTSFVVTVIGVTTALAAGFIAVGQWDIKRVLAYSTISQLGFMVAAVGVGAYGPAIFHMVTHAFFKALLFLGSGSVIHAMEHGHHHVHEHGHDDGHDEEHHDDDFDPQDMRFMGGLSQKMPITYYTYLAGTLALAGIIPFAGFWSKDEILADSWLAGFFGTSVWQQLSGFMAVPILLAAAGFTAFYMWRQIELVFHGQARSEAAEHAPESVPAMTTPLLILGLFAVIIGFINVPSGLLGLSNIFGKGELVHFLEYSLAHAHPYHPLGGVFNPLIGLTALALGIIAILAARRIYGQDNALTASDQPDQLEAHDNPVVAQGWSLANARLYWDEAYFRFVENPYNQSAKFLADRIDWEFWHDYFHDNIIGKGFNRIAKLLSEPIDLGLIDWTVNAVGRLANSLSQRLRGVQTGYVRTYAVSLLLGVVFVIIIILLPLLQNGG